MSIMNKKNWKKLLLASIVLIIVGVASFVSFIYISRSDVEVEFWVTCTGEGGERLEKQQNLTFKPGLSLTSKKISVSADKKFQEIQGFGAALTDSSAWLIHEVLNESEYNRIMNALFHPAEGIGMSYLRIPVGSSDCALEFYSYDDTAPNLDDFSIAHDEDYIIPLLKDAKSLNPDLKLMASPWSAPGWMKIGNNMSDPSTKGLINGTLNPDKYEEYANYLVKFLLSYENLGLSFDAITLQNEQFYTPNNYPGMFLNISQTQDFAQILGSALEDHSLDTRMLILDHNWVYYEDVLEILSDDNARNQIDGVAWHGYGEASPEYQSIIHNEFPDMAHYFTEISPLQAYTSFPDNMAWTYHNIYVGGLRNWAQTALLWNLALDQNGGPILTEENVLRGVITIPQEDGSLQAKAKLEGEYYMIGHLSKFVVSGAHRIASSNFEAELETLAFENPDGSMVLVVCNPTEFEQNFDVSWDYHTVGTTIPANSLITMKWK